MSLRRAPILIGHVVQRISPIGHGPAVGDHPAIQILGLFETDSDHATVAVYVALFAAHSRSSDLVGQGEARLLSATPPLSARSHAELAALGRIDPEQPNALAMDLNGVAVYQALPTIGTCALTGTMAQASKNNARPKARHVIC
jgi:hypothetical protein